MTTQETREKKILIGFAKFSMCPADDNTSCKLHELCVVPSCMEELHFYDYPAFSQISVNYIHQYKIENNLLKASEF